MLIPKLAFWGNEYGQCQCSLSLWTRWLARRWEYQNEAIVSFANPPTPWSQQACRVTGVLDLNSATKVSESQRGRGRAMCLNSSRIPPMPTPCRWRPFRTNLLFDLSENLRCTTEGVVVGVGGMSEATQVNLKITEDRIELQRLLQSNYNASQRDANTPKGLD